MLPVLEIAAQFAKIVLWIAFLFDIATSVHIYLNVAPILDYAAIQLISFHIPGPANAALNRLYYLCIADPVLDLINAFSYSMVYLGIVMGNVKVTGNV